MFHKPLEVQCTPDMPACVEEQCTLDMPACVEEQCTLDMLACVEVQCTLDMPVYTHSLTAKEAKTGGSL